MREAVEVDLGHHHLLWLKVADGKSIGGEGRNWSKQFRPMRSLIDRSGLSPLARWSTCLDLDRLGGLCDLSRLLDIEMQHTLVEMSLDSCILRFEWQRHRTVE